jgi:hypothetical protein
MKFEEPRFTMLFSEDGMEISVKDNKSASLIMKLNLTPDQVMKVLSRLVVVECRGEICNLDKINKTHEHKYYEFEVGEEMYYRDNQEQLKELALMSCPKGWAPDLRFNSQNSFFLKNGKYFARDTCRRWTS